MINFKRKNNNGIRDELFKRINELISNNKYKLKLLHYDPLHFGNVIIELTNDKNIVRFIYDKGDIYNDMRAINSEKWIQERLVYTHSTTCH